MLAFYDRKLGLDVEAKLLALHKGLNRKPEYLAINPLGKVPCLQVFPADGGQVWDSTPAKLAVCSARLHACNQCWRREGNIRMTCGQAQGLPESCAILRYLATTNQSVVPDISKWYPGD